jgi:glycosyltransferase involved in cell wall biosynthesis
MDTYEPSYPLALPVMKILVVAPTPFFSDRGTHIRILEEALALEKRGHEITVATYHIGSDLPKELETKMDVRRIRRLLFWYKKLEAGPDWQKIVLDLLLIKKVFFLARTQRPDIIHAHLHEGVLIGWVVRKLLFWRRMKLVADFHGSLTKEMVSHAYLGSGWLKKLFRMVEQWIDNLGDAAVTSSWENTEEIGRIRKDGRVTTVLDGVSVDRYEGLAAKEELRRQFDLPSDKTIVAYAGALIPNKGIRYLLDAIPLALQKHPEIHFLIAGFPYDQIAPAVEGAAWRNAVTVVSPLPYFELPKLLSASDIAVDPKDGSTAQASGKMLQYMGAGLPVACFERSNNREYLGEGGTYASEMTGESLAAAIGELAGLPEPERRRRGAGNRERARQFTYAKPAEQLEDIYERIIKG